MHALLNGSTVDAASLGVNDSLNFGRFDRVEGLNYEIRLALAELSARIEAPWDQLIHEMRDDDRRDEKSSALERMNYPVDVASDGLAISGRCFNRCLP